ncbi:hypothetical protein B1P95_05125 [Enterococcus faecium]|uniref:Uncharacterized protein n=1 Tax=Enterococcus faecium TaxID=1352 RepID=A0A1S8JTG5_ENTFC|nr:hypothetical protein HMPREF1377_01337 [Enterococcus faecium R494]OOL50841.1 hypothetical protein B1P93_01680 [Enterococcus faecium]OOL51063.1 hypothetical protein B1P90_00775 [Enterococcus faecium]OOL52136.1 hypothetical protein B1P89_01555 [Enterococcus faecium]OOL57254.1 hypothetical protein B1P94_01915 [Enterococcus faecium]
MPKFLSIIRIRKKAKAFFVFAPTKMFQLFSFFIPVFLIFRMTG